MSSEINTGSSSPERKGMMGSKFVHPFVDAVRGVWDSLTKWSLPNTDQASIFRVYRLLTIGSLLITTAAGVSALSSAAAGNFETSGYLAMTLFFSAGITGIMAEATRKAYLDVK